VLVRVGSCDFVDLPLYAAKRTIHEITRTNTKRSNVDQRLNSTFDTPSIPQPSLLTSSFQNRSRPGHHMLNIEAQILEGHISRR
jgi:hypothetical protein